MVLEVKTWDTSVKYSYAAVKFFKCLYLDSQSSKKHTYLEHVYVHAIFIQVHGHLCFINQKGSSGARSTFVVAMIILHSAMPSRVHICIAVFTD